MFSNSKSRQGNKASQVFCTADGWTRAFFMAKEKDAHEALSLLFHRDGLPNVMVMDGAKAQIQGDFRRKLREAGYHIKQTDPHIPTSNTTEGSIRELKRGVGRKMVRYGAPKRLWDDCLVREAYVRSSTVLDIFYFEGKVPDTIVKGHTSDIYPLTEYAWYEWVKFRDTGQSFPDSKEWIDRDLGPAIDIGPAMSRKVLKINGEVMFRVSVRGLTLDEMQNPDEQKRRQEYYEAIKMKLGKGMQYYELKLDPDFVDFVDFVTPNHNCYKDKKETALQMHDIDDLDEHDVDTYDQYVDSSVQLSIGDKVQTGKVTGRKRGLDGVERWKASANPIIDKITYNVEFPDDRSEEYTANAISENMYAQCDEEGNHFLMMQDIVGHKTDGHAVECADMYIKVGSNKQIRKTTKGWHLCVEWKDGTTSWERLADLKESNLVEVAEYAVIKKLYDEPEFVWWVPHVLKKQNRLIAAVTKRYHKCTHKFGIQVPKTWGEAVKLDEDLFDCPNHRESVDCAWS
jgi:hypothetical protein